MITKMMSEKANKVLSSIYNDVREKFLEMHPGANENDVERNFLYTVYYGVNNWHCNHPQQKQLSDQIKEIR